MEESCSKSQLEGRTLASMVDDHQEWQSQVEGKLSDLTADQQSKDLKTIELLDAQSTEAHFRNDRLEDKLKRLECQVEEQRRQILHLESIPRMTKQELNTPDKEIQRKLFEEMGQSSQSHSQIDPPGDSSGSNQPPQSIPPQSHLGNDKGGSDCAALRETVRRLSFWIMQITGATDIEENPDNVSFPNSQTCRELLKLKKEVETLQNQPMQGLPFQESRGRSKDFLPRKEWGDIKGGTQGSDESIRSVLEPPKAGSCASAGDAEEPGFDKR